MPRNVFQELAEKVRQLSKENAELKANKEPSMEQLAKYGKLQQENEELKRKNILADKLLKQADNDICKLLKDLKNVEIYSQGFQKDCIERLKEQNQQLLAQLKEYEQTCEQLLSEVMEAPPKYETLGGVGKEDMRNPLLIQALVRGYLMRKLMSCCVCYEPTKTKNKCCNSYLCGVCRPRCNGKCPVCRKRFPINLTLNTNLNLTPTYDDHIRLRSWDRRDTNGVRVFNPHLAVVHNPRYEYDLHMTRQERHHYQHHRNRQLNHYNNLTFDQIPETHQFNMFDTQDLGWGCDLLTFLREHRLYQDPSPYISREHINHIHGGNVDIYIGTESKIRESVLWNGTRTSREWSQLRNCPRLITFNYNEENIDSSFTHPIGNYPLGGSNGIPREFLNNNPEFKGNTNIAREKRVWHKILQASVEMKTEENNYMNWGYFMLKRNPRYENYTCYIMRLEDDPAPANIMFDMSEDEDE